MLLTAVARADTPAALASMPLTQVRTKGPSGRRQLCFALCRKRTWSQWLRGSVPAPRVRPSPALCDHGLVRLRSGDAASVELRPVGYQFSRQVAAGAAKAERAAGTGGDWDANWLMIHGDIRTADERYWTFTDPCLTTWEAERLSAWLRAAASKDPAGRQEAVFTEPNLSFMLDGQDGQSVRIRVGFSHESLPSWMPRKLPGWQAQEYFLPLEVSRVELAEAARSWDLDRLQFPAR
jgi:hypothetical protein